MSLMPRHIVLDDFLPPGLHDALLEHALDQQEMFAPGTVRIGGIEGPGDARKNQVCKASLGDLKPQLQEAINNALPAIFEGLAIPPFEPHSIELELSVHRNGDFYRPHVDTFVSIGRISAVTPSSIAFKRPNVPPTRTSTNVRPSAVKIRKTASAMRQASEASMRHPRSSRGHSKRQPGALARAIEFDIALVV